MAKETIYIEADDEITTVIDKVLSAKDAIVAIVLPKRATVFQSLVNMKLLKKAAEENKKKVVLISSEPAITSIAAVAGMYLAQSLSSKPGIPKRAKLSKKETIISSSELEAPEDEVTSIIDADGEINLDVEPMTKQDETIELDNTTNDAQEVPAGSLAASSVDKKKKRLIKIPDFGSFQVRMWLGIILVTLLGVGWYVGFVVMPKAVITINTDTSSSTITFDFTAQTAIKELDMENSLVPATLVEVMKENKATVPATGEKNVGEKASGEMTIVNCTDDTLTIPVGTIFTNSGLSFSLSESVNVPASDFFSAANGGACKENGKSTGVVNAVSSGSSFNLSNGREYNSEYSSNITGIGDDMTGGTDTVIKVVSAQDIATAREQLKGASSANALADLKSTLEAQQLQALSETLTEGEPTIKNSAAVDAEATEVTVTQTVKYQMLGVKSSDLGLLLSSKITQSLKDDPTKNVRNNGLDSAAYRLVTKTADDSQTISLQTIATLGPEFDEATIRKDVASKKRGDIERMLETRDGVRSVSVDYIPFWITTTPKNANKITIVVNEVEN